MPRRKHAQISTDDDAVPDPWSGRLRPRPDRTLAVQTIVQTAVPVIVAQSRNPQADESSSSDDSSLSSQNSSLFRDYQLPERREERNMATALTSTQDEDESNPGKGDLEMDQPVGGSPSSSGDHELETVPHVPAEAAAPDKTPPASSLGDVQDHQMGGTGRQATTCEESRNGNLQGSPSANEKPASQSSDDFDDDGNPRWFEHIGKPFTDPEDYKKDGFLAVHVGDIIWSGRNKIRYQILNLLGSGGFAAVWLARDTIHNRYVAIKIAKADNLAWHRAGLKSPPEVSNYQRLQEILTPAQRDRILVPLHDWFVKKHKTFDQRHLCLVFGLAGTSIGGMTDGRPPLKLRHDMVTTLARELAEALQILHSAGMTWGDLNSRNVTLQFANVDDLSEEELYDLTGKPVETAVKARPGHEDDADATGLKYVYAPLNFTTPKALSLLEPGIKCIDFADSYFTHPPEAAGVCRAVADPEYIFWDDPLDQASDIWAMACVFYKIRTGISLFNSHGGDEADKELACEHLATIGPCPPAWFRRLRTQLHEELQRLQNMDDENENEDEGPYSTLPPGVTAANDPFYVAPWMLRMDDEMASKSWLGRGSPALLRRKAQRLTEQIKRFSKLIDRGCIPSVLQAVADQCQCSHESHACFYPHDQTKLRTRAKWDNESVQLQPGERTLHWRLRNLPQHSDDVVYQADDTNGESDDTDVQPRIVAYQAAIQQGAELLRQRAAAGAEAPNPNPPQLLVEHQEEATHHERQSIESRSREHLRPISQSRKSSADSVTSADTVMMTDNPAPEPLSEEEARDFEDLLLMCLTWYRRDRASLEEILRMPWLSGKVYPRQEQGREEEGEGGAGGENGAEGEAEGVEQRQVEEGEPEEESEQQQGEEDDDEEEPWLQPCRRAPSWGNVHAVTVKNNRIDF